MDIKQQQVLNFLTEVATDLPLSDRRKIAREHGVELPPPALSEQLTEASLQLNHTPKNAKEGSSPRDYAVIPKLELSDGTTTRPLWVRLDAARAVGERLVALADQAEAARESE